MRRIDDIEIRERLLTWFDRERRPMPWREDPGPYKVWVSEIMLQQTQVATVIPHFERFIDRFPGPAELAAADLEDVLAAWSGLGYYRRARNLWKAAGRIVEHFDGAVPSDPKLLESLPGVGRYTAGAIASIAFGRRSPALDGNQVRVITRLGALEGDSGRNPLKAELWSRAAALVDCRRPGDLNQALMELGARLCKPRSPRCRACPVQRNCRSCKEGRPEDYPQRHPRPRPLPVRLEVGLFQRSGRVLLCRGERPFLGDLWNLPYRVREGGGFRREDWRQLGLEASGLHPLGEHKMSITRYRIAQETVAGDVELLVGENLPEYRWFDPSELAKLGLPAFTKKLLDRYVTGAKGGKRRRKR